MTNKTDLSIIFKALEFSALKHRDQRRKDEDATPYINHPIAVANMIINEGDIADTETICAAILHDTIEDTETTPQELSDIFGNTICTIVQEVTDDKTLPKAERKQAQVDHGPHLSKKAKSIKLADKTCNLRDVAKCPPPDWSLERRQQYFDWANKVIDSLRGDWPNLEKVFDSQFNMRP